MKYFAMFDKKSGAFGSNIFSSTSIPEAVRAVQMALDDGKATLAKFPAEFQLFYIGDFDPMTGIMTPANERGPQFLQEVSSILSDYLLTRATAQKGGA